MRLKELFYFLNLKPQPKKYGYKIVQFDLATEGRVDYAQWLHPKESDKHIRQEEVDELRRFVRPGDVVIDVGAHSGDSTIPMALAAGRQGCVFALEPNGFVYPVLQKNAALNEEKTRIVPLDFAATEDDGDFEFEYSDAGFCNGGLHKDISKWRHGHAFKLKVTGKNLERFLMEWYPAEVSNIRYIKTDCEGYDLEVLKSLKALIAKTSPFLKVEVFKHLSEDRRRELYGLLCNLGYRVFKFENEAHYRGALLQAGDLMRWRHYDIFAVPANES